jgi:tetratricopeptide (TPR) repeat protein
MLTNPSRCSVAGWSLALFLAATPSASAQDPSASPRDDNWKQCKDADPEARLIGCRAIIQSDKETPSDKARAHYYRAAAYRAKKLLDLSLDDSNESIKLDPTFVDAYGERGITLTAVGRLMDAIPDFTHVVEADPKSAYAFYDRGLCYELLGLDDLALEDFSAAIALLPNDAFKWERRGTIYFRKGQLDQALADYDKALTVDPQYAPALYGRGVVKMKKGDLAGGGADIAQAKHFEESVDRDMRRSGVRP